jgi:hypothetical protein
VLQGSALPDHGTFGDRRTIVFWVSSVQSGIGPGNARFRDEKKGQKDGQSGMRGQQRAMARGGGSALAGESKHRSSADQRGIWCLLAFSLGLNSPLALIWFAAVDSFLAWRHFRRRQEQGGCVEGKGEGRQDEVKLRPRAPAQGGRLYFTRATGSAGG